MAILKVWDLVFTIGEYESAVWGEQMRYRIVNGGFFTLHIIQRSFEQIIESRQAIAVAVKR